MKEVMDVTEDPIVTKNHLVKNEWSIIFPEGFHPVVRGMTERGVWIRLEPNVNHPMHRSE